MTPASHWPSDDRPPWFSTMTLMPAGSANSRQPARGRRPRAVCCSSKRAVARRVDPNRDAAERVGRIDPLAVVLDGPAAQGRVGIAQPALAVAHDEVLVDAFAGGAAVHLRQVRRVGRPVLEERVDVLDGLDAELALGDRRKVQVVELAWRRAPGGATTGRARCERAAPAATADRWQHQTRPGAAASAAVCIKNSRRVTIGDILALLF